jgi:hypothetical protein
LAARDSWLLQGEETHSRYTLFYRSYLICPAAKMGFYIGQVTLRMVLIRKGFKSSVKALLLVV